jgi:hypothetical protein
LAALCGTDRLAAPAFSSIVVAGPGRGTDRKIRRVAEKRSGSVPAFPHCGGIVQCGLSSPGARALVRPME